MTVGGNRKGLTPLFPSPHAHTLIEKLHIDTATSVALRDAMKWDMCGVLWRVINNSSAVCASLDGIADDVVGRSSWTRGHADDARCHRT